mmetsp:Transcript_68855/g.165273  ORF Transcript_68855/g.165273 Transcript_68855/m.165273 type:complete len:193 (+) Transcript_68855:94-672(+)
MESSYQHLNGADCELDFEFRCNHCVQIIAKDQPVYMRRDRSYCSARCRRRGRSTLYLNVRVAQLSASQRSAGSESLFSPTHLSSALSDSSLSSSVRSTTRSKGEVVERQNRGTLSWIVGGLFSALASRVPGAQLVRAASEMIRSRIPEESSLRDIIDIYPGDCGSEDGSCTHSRSNSSETLLGPFGLYSALR